MMLSDIVQRVVAFKLEAHTILSAHEAAPSRAVLLDFTLKRLQGLSLQQKELLEQALRCIQNQLYKAAHIMAWTALIDLLENILLASDNLKNLKKVRPKWKISSLDELRENYPEFQIIEACKDIKLISKSEMRILKGFLSKRNLCAHPSNFSPDYNQTLGYVSDIINMMQRLQNKSH